MYYAFFLKKFKGDKSLFPTTKLVKEYIKSIGKDDYVLCVPGYMSTTQKTINDVIRKMEFPIFTYFFKGMNGQRILKNSKRSIQDNHNDIIKQRVPHSSSSDYANFLMLISKICQDDDHSKIIAFLEHDKTVQPVNYITQCHVKAMLIGSSNQSHNTYFGTNNKADKGEADVFIIDAQYLSGKSTEDSNNNECKDSKDDVIKKLYNDILKEDKNDIASKIILLKEMNCNINNSQLLTEILKELFIDIKIIKLGETETIDKGDIYNKQIPEIIVSKNTKNIANNVFSRYKKLSKVYYEGTHEQWNGINFGKDNDKLKKVYLYFYSETEPALNAEGTAYDGDYWHYVDDVVTVWVKEE